MELDTLEKACKAYGTAGRPIPASEAAIMAYVAILSTMHDCPHLEIHPWSELQPTLPHDVRLNGCHIWGAPNALLDQIEQAIADAGSTWKLVRSDQPRYAYIYDAG